MELHGKTVGVLVEDLYQELEVWYPIYRLREAGAKVITIGTGSKMTYKSKMGYEVKADTAAAEVLSDELDALVIPGGYAPDILRRNDGVLRLVRECFERGKIVAAICHAAWVPISAGIVKGRTMTCYFAIKDDVINAGGKYVDQEVVVDKNLISARTPDDLPAFLREIIKGLKGR